jgi:hypothetical protein
MKEANLLSLVTLTPRDRGLLPITIQPLLCSDVLNVSTNSPRNHPLDAITSERSCFRKEYSDHIDVVSVATCTRSALVGAGNGQFAWHQEFRDAFKRAAADDQYRRHQFALFALSNYRDIPAHPTPGKGGLSGVFYPMPLVQTFQLEQVSKPQSILCHQPSSTTQAYAGENVRWESHDTPCDAQSRRNELGYMVAMDPAVSRNAIATVFDLTVTHLPRDANRWARRATIHDLRFYHVATVSPESPEAQFQLKLLNSRGNS